MPTPQSRPEQVRLPLQIGRAALNQGARFAALVWLGPILLVFAAVLGTSGERGFGSVVAILGFGIPGLLALVFAVASAVTAAGEGPSDMVLDAKGFAIEGGPLDGTRHAYDEIVPASCRIVAGDERRALRWMLFDEKRSHVAVHRLQLKLRSVKGEPMKLAEVEGEELASLVQLRDSLVSAAHPPAAKNAPPLPQNILKCPHCGAAQVPASAPTMTCLGCDREVTVPAELQERMRANAELEANSAERAEAVRKLVDQPSARHAGHVLRGARCFMVWCQPALFGVMVALMVHQGRTVATGAGIEVVRGAPGDDGLYLYDLGLFALLIAALFAIAWSTGDGYVARRQALRVLADDFGAVPPLEPGAPSTCHQCGAPLPGSTALLVHCVYCAAENVIGVDRRPAALRRKRERIDLTRGLAIRQRARTRLVLTCVLSPLAAGVMGWEIHRAWEVPRLDADESSMCSYPCGTVTNDDCLARTVTFSSATNHVATTILPHGTLKWHCSSCTLDIGTARTTPPPGRYGGSFDPHIEHGELRP